MSSTPARCTQCGNKFVLGEAPENADHWRCPNFGCGLRFWEADVDGKVRLGLDPEVRQVSNHLRITH